MNLKVNEGFQKKNDWILDNISKIFCPFCGQDISNNRFAKEGLGGVIESGTTCNNCNVEIYTYKVLTRKYDNTMSTTSFIRTLEEKVNNYENISGNKIHPILLKHGVTYKIEGSSKKAIKDIYFEKGYYYNHTYIEEKGKETGKQISVSMLTIKGQKWLANCLEKAGYIIIKEEFKKEFELED